MAESARGPSPDDNWTENNIERTKSCYDTWLHSFPAGKVCCSVALWVLGEIQTELLQNVCSILHTSRVNRPSVIPYRTPYVKLSNLPPDETKRAGTSTLKRRGWGDNFVMKAFRPECDFPVRLHLPRIFAHLVNDRSPNLLKPKSRALPKMSDVVPNRRPPNMQL